MKTISIQNIVLSILLAGISLLLVPLSWMAILVLIFILAYLLIGNDLIYASVIIFFLTISSDIDPQLRTMGNALAFFILFFLFLKKYGIAFERYPKLPKDIRVLIGVVFISLVIPALFSVSLKTGMAETIRQLVFFLLVYFFYGFIVNRDKIFLLILTLMAAGMLIVLGVYYSFMTSSTSLYFLQTMGFVTVSGFFNNPSAVGGFLAISVSLHITLLLLPKDHWIKKYRTIISISLVLQIVGLLLTNSRAAIAAGLIAGFLQLWFMKKALMKKVTITMLIAIVILFFMPQVQEMFSLYFRTGRVLENTRYFLWSISWDMFLQHPLFGSGPGLYSQYMYDYMPVLIGSWDEAQLSKLFDQAAIGHAHNFLLMKLSEQGLFGLLIVVVFLKTFYKNVLYCFRETKEHPEFHILTIGIFSIVTGLLVRSIFESTGFITNGWITRDLPFWLLFAILLYIRKTLDYQK